MENPTEQKLFIVASVLMWAATGFMALTLLLHIVLFFEKDRMLPYLPWMVIASIGCGVVGGVLVSGKFKRKISWWKGLDEREQKLHFVSQYLTFYLVIAGCMLAASVDLIRGQMFDYWFYVTIPSTVIAPMLFQYLLRGK